MPQAQGGVRWYRKNLHPSNLLFYKKFPFCFILYAGKVEVCWTNPMHVLSGKTASDTIMSDVVGSGKGSSLSFPLNLSNHLIRILKI